VWRTFTSFYHYANIVGKLGKAFQVVTIKKGVGKEGKAKVE
jgi:hypothetical protein